MAKAIKTGLLKSMIGTPFKKPIDENLEKIVHDGDTINIDPVGHFAVRFLGIDTPEESFQTGFDRHAQKAFRKISDPKWQEYLADPFAAKWGPFELDNELKAHLRGKVGPDCATNHARHAARATDTLREMVRHDMNVLVGAGLEPDFFLVFGAEILDGYGRLLCFINRNQPDRDQPEPRPQSYNARLLEAGLATIYTIWPNIDPYHQSSSIEDAVFSPGQLQEFLDRTSSLAIMRDHIKRARANQFGIFDSNDPLAITPSELRVLGRRQSPFRWVLDLGGNHPRLIEPQKYYTIPMEDRLYLNPDHASLFKAHGW